jgi:hypothetical protein
MIRSHPRLPLVGDQVHARLGRGKAKTKTFLRRENHERFGGSARLRWSAPNDLKITRKETLLPSSALPTFRLILR